MNDAEMNAAVRAANKQRRVGDGAVCAFCGEQDPTALVPPKRSVLEKHHAVGRANDPQLTIILCRNCHAKQTADLANANASMRPSPTFLETLCNILRALSAFFQMLATCAAKWGDRLSDFIAGLDSMHPDWREALGAV